MDTIRKQYEEILAELAVPTENTDGIELGTDEELKKLST
jgi:hypothetical protein